MGANGLGAKSRSPFGRSYYSTVVVVGSDGGRAQAASTEVGDSNSRVGDGRLYDGDYSGRGAALHSPG